MILELFMEEMALKVMDSLNLIIQEMPGDLFKNGIIQLLMEGLQLWNIEKGDLEIEDIIMEIKDSINRDKEMAAMEDLDKEEEDINSLGDFIYQTIIS